MSVESVITKRRAALVDLASGVGVGVQAAPSCPCSSCQLEVWEDRVAFDAELGVLDTAPALLLPHEEGVMARLVLAAVRLD